jgi:hypothetical protein
MPNKNETIDIILDTNALEFICDCDRFEELMRRIKQLLDDSVLRIHFNVIAFCERLEGIVEKHFENARDHIRKASTITGRTFILPPKQHLMKCIGLFPEEDIRNEALIWFKLFQGFCSCKDYDDFKSVFATAADDLRHQNESILQGANRIYSFIQQIKESNKSEGKITKFNLNLSEVFNFKRVLRDNFPRRYDLYEPTRQMAGYLMEKKLRSISYLTDAYFYYSKKVFNGMKPQSGDHNDLELIVYLNACDYLMTRDKRLIDILQKSGNEDLMDRYIKPDIFISKVLHGPFDLRKRARDSVVSIPIRQ